MTSSIPIPFPIPFPSGAADGPVAPVTYHRDTEAPNHRTVASAKTRSRKAVTKTTRIDPSQEPFNGRDGRFNHAPGRGLVARPEGLAYSGIGPRRMNRSRVLQGPPQNPRRDGAP